jgi:phosphatidylglycerophosphate synthase
MLDGWARARIDPLLDHLAVSLAQRGITANAITLAAFGAGVAAFVTISLEAYLLGLLLLLASRLGDGLDGAVARHTQKTDFGGYLDIVLDFAFYGLIPLGFVLVDPAANSIAGAVLILSFYVNGASFLAYAVMAEKRGLSTDARGEKSLFFTTGLAEATETICFFVAFCLFPEWFAVLALLFATLCFYTALSRIIIAGRTFGNRS